MGSEDQLGCLDLSFQDVFSEGEEVDACSSAICERSVNVNNEEVFCGSGYVSEGEREGQANESNNVESSLIVKQVDSNVAENNPGKLAEEECGELELSLGSDFSEKHITSLGLIKSVADEDMLISKTGVVKNTMEEIDNKGWKGEDSSSGRVSAILKGWVNPQFAPHCSPIKLNKMKSLGTECQITRSQLKDALFIGQVNFVFFNKLTVNFSG